MSVLSTYFNPEAIELAYYRVQCSTDKLSKDQVGLRAFGSNLEKNAETFSQKIITGRHVPARGFKYYMPKASKTHRTKTILFIEDAILYQAIANRIAELNYEKLRQFDSFVFGSVLSPEVAKGVNILKEEDPQFFFFKFWRSLFQKFKQSVIHSIEVDKVNYKFETDITGFFDCIPHYNLLGVLSERFGVEDEILDILADCFNRWSGTKESLTPGVGIPQGPAPSFFFANLLLHDLDKIIVGKGLSYYRYMDDISIYGYDESQLLESLVSIDNYLKSNGLSLNAKKTNIEKIDHSKEDDTVKILKRFSSFNFYSGEFEESEVVRTKNKPKGEKLDVEINKLSEQDHAEFNFGLPVVETLETEEEIVKYWESEKHAVSIGLPKLFRNPQSEIESLELLDDTVDVDFIAFSARFGTAVSKLRSLGIEQSLDTSLVKYWLFAYDRFFWRANMLGLTLGNYRKNEQVKAFLLSRITGKFRLYEWVRYFAIQTISISQSFTDMELRTIFFKLLKDEESDLVKISLYRLLFKQTGNSQFMVTVDRELQQESNQYLKLLILDFKRNYVLGKTDLSEFIDANGI